MKYKIILLRYLQNIVLLNLIILLFPVLSLAQKMTIPRDTSFTVYQTYVKEKKRFPFIQIVPADLPKGVIAKENLVYATIPHTPYGKRDLHLNLYRPDDNQKYPALIMVHGGGWNSGNLTLQIPMAQKIAAKGYVTVPVEYRLIPEAVYPAGLHDVKAVIRWIRANADKLGVDADKIAVSGCSAGAQLVSLIGATNGLKEYDGTEGTVNFSSDVQAVINIDGILDFTSNESIDRAQKAKENNEKLPVDALWLGGTYEDRKDIWKAASPIFWVSEKTPPFCFINSSIPRFHYGRDEMISKLNNLKIYSEVHTMPETPHPFWFFYPWQQTTVNYMVNFLNKVFKPDATLVDANKYDFVVAQDGSGNFKTVQEAVNAVPDYRKIETRIYIKNGIYHEKIVVPDSKTFVTLIGEDAKKTILTYDDYAQKKNTFGEEVGTQGSSSVYIFGDDFCAKNITFENASGPVGQAVAMFVKADRVAFYNCLFFGFQDTVCTYDPQGRQYFESCYIEGTTDFIFGSSASWFEKCDIYCKRNSYITAANTPESSKYGYIFNNCRIELAKGVDAMYLGRPWRPFSMTLFMNSFLPEGINPVGWHNWDKESNELTARYMEYNNQGPGANTSKRVKWSKILSKEEALIYSYENVIKREDRWNPAEREF